MTTQVDITERLAELQARRRAAMDERVHIEVQIATGNQRTTTILVSRWETAKMAEASADRLISDLVFNVSTSNAWTRIAVSPSVAVPISSFGQEFAPASEERDTAIGSGEVHLMLAKDMADPDVRQVLDALAR